jgi:tetratricopeptide (TPR) repeat protein
MLDRSLQILKRRADEVVFIELKPGKTLEFGGVTLTDKTPIPIRLDRIVDKVKGADDADFTPDNIIDGMCWTLGFDPVFPYAEIYREFLTALLPGLIHELREKARILEEDQDRWFDAVIYLHACVQIAPDNAELKYHLARCVVHQAELFSYDPDAEKRFEDDAFDLLTEMMNQHPDFSPAYYLMGFQLVNRKSYKAAETVWERALQLGLEDNMRDDVIRQLDDLWARIQYEEGYVLVLDGFADEGLVKLLPLVEFHDEWWNLLFFIGLAYRQKAQFDDALEYYRRALRLNTGSPEIHNEIGLCLMALGHYHEAEQVYEEALRMRPNDSELMCNLGIVAMKLGDIPRARQLIMEAYKLNPEDEVAAAWLRHLETDDSILS